MRSLAKKAVPYNIRSTPCAPAHVATDIFASR